ncbi:MAG: DUF3108 domain-containing protein [Deltaproteobacteria bacterium]|nr:DUF3108 domain-containing protein [Deltaproteobacteria bacterium]
MRLKAIRLFLSVVFLVSFLSWARGIGAEPRAPAHAPADKSRSIADAFLDEELVYEIGFWLFDEVAVGKVTLKKDNGEYAAVLTAYTTGVVDKILKHRKDTYVSRMKLAEGGKRFVTLSFEKTIDTNGEVRKSVTRFDYDKNVMTWRSWGGGKEEKSGTIDLPEDRYCDDPIAAFYNFRYGVYGPAEKGREYTIYSFPKEDRLPKIYLKIATDEEMEKRLNKPVDYLADAKIDKELFGSKSGDIEIAFTKDMVPVEAVAKGLVFFGDVRGRLVHEGVNTSDVAIPEAASLE